MSNFTKPSASTVTGILQYVNEVTNGMFNIFFLVAFLIINFMAMSYYGVKQAAPAALFNTVIMSVFMVAMGLMTGMDIVFMLIVLLVGVVIYVAYSKLSGGI